MECPNCSHSLDAVPKDRFAKVTAQKREAQDRLATAEAELSAAQVIAATASTHQETAERLQGELEAERGKFSSYRTIGDAGLPPDLVDAVEWSWSRLDQDTRPSLGEWLETMKAEPDSAPAVLRPHLQALAPPAPAESNGTPAPPSASPPSPPVHAEHPHAGGTTPPAELRRPPPENRGTRVPPRPGSTFDAQQIASMTPAEYRAHRQAILSTQ